MGFLTGQMKILKKTLKANVSRERPLFFQREQNNMIKEKAKTKKRMRKVKYNKTNEENRQKIK